ncbi:MAG: hypothetical protein AB7L91_17620 [Dehalococcoidia bacterium]|jgi:adenosylmethionine-8-amino-7-oxononanoate aminotransferase
MADSARFKQHVHRHYPTVDRGHGVFLYDTDGKRYLDGFAGPMTVSIGHPWCATDRVAGHHARAAG